MKYRVMQMIETGEEFNVYEGSYEACCRWIDEESDSYPESRFAIERI